MTDERKIPWVANRKDVKNVTEINTETKHVNVTCVTKNGNGYIRCDWGLDFSSCTERDILALATRSFVISEQNKIRATKRSELAGIATRKIDVKEVLDAERKSGPRVATVESTVKQGSKLSKEDRLELIKQLMQIDEEEKQGNEE